jgi:hypothetical protein
MKMLLKIVGGILVCLVVLLLVFRVTGLEPRDATGSFMGIQYHGLPGLWLKGNLVTTPVSDWSFTDKVPTIKVQTRTWYMLPHSVPITCTAYNGQLYLTSTYPKADQYPKGGRSWNSNVARDPHVRLKIGNQLFDRTLSVVTDPAEKAAVLEAKAKKYPENKASPRNVVVFRVTSD